MQKILIIFMLLLSFVFSEVAIDGAEAGKWTMDIEAAFELSKDKKLPMLINFTGSDWCYWCKIMDKNVFEKKTWKEYAKDNLVLVTIDFPSNKNIVPEKYKERNTKLAEQFGVKGYPTFILLDHEKTQIGQLGAGKDKTPENFRREIEVQVNLSPEGIEKTMQKLSTADKAKYKAILVNHKEIISELDSWLETKPDRSEANLKKYQDFLGKIDIIENKLSKFWK